jgi:hypothetical protein
MHYRSIPASGLKARTVAVGCSRDPLSLDLTLLAVIGRTCSWPGPSVGVPVWQVVWLHAVGALIPGHDVSRIGRQTLGRAMQSITTMIPVWQCGHSRNDCPVSASNRSR